MRHYVTFANEKNRFSLFITGPSELSILRQARIIARLMRSWIAKI